MHGNDLEVRFSLVSNLCNSCTLSYVAHMLLNEFMMVDLLFRFLPAAMMDLSA